MNLETVHDEAKTPKGLIDLSKNEKLRTRAFNKEDPDMLDTGGTGSSNARLDLPSTQGGRIGLIRSLSKKKRQPSQHKDHESSQISNSASYNFLLGPGQNQISISVHQG